MAIVQDSPSHQARLDILKAALKHVPFEGWTAKTLKMAVKDTDLPKGSDALYFPGGALELIRFWAETADTEASEQISAKGLHNMRIRDKITESAWLRLQAMAGHEEAARRAIARLSLPDAIGQGPKQLWASADMIWRAIGDTSTDVNFYSKRTILAGVIGSTIMSYLSDDTPGKSRSRTFLESRIENVMQFEKAKLAFRKRRETWPDPAGFLGRVRYGRRRRRYR